MSFCETQQCTMIDGVTHDIVRAYRLWLHRQQTIKGEPLSRQTQNYHLIALRSLLKYCSKRDIETLAPEKIELADIPDREIIILDPDEIERLLNAPSASNRVGKRDRALCNILFSTGLRLRELAALNCVDVNKDTGEFYVRGKGGKIRIVFLSDRARESIFHIFQPEQIMTRTFYQVEISEDNQDMRLSTRQIERIVTNTARMAGIVKPVHPIHSVIVLRPICCTVAQICAVCRRYSVMHRLRQRRSTPMCPTRNLKKYIKHSRETDAQKSQI